MQERCIRLIVAFDVNHATVGSFHDEGNAIGLGVPAEISLGAHLVTRIANEVQPFHERLGIFCRESIRKQLHLEVGIHFGNGACNGHRFRHAQMVHTGLNAIQVGQLEHVKIRQFQFATCALHDQRHVQCTAHREPGDAHTFGGKNVLLLGSNLVAVAVGAYGDECHFGQQTHPRLAPREPGPCAECLPACFANLVLNSLGQGVRLLAQGRRFRHQPLHQLFLEGVDDFAFPVTHGFLTRRAFCTVFQPVEYRLRSE